MARIEGMQRFSDTTTHQSLILGIPQDTSTIITAEGLSDRQQTALANIVCSKEADLFKEPIPSLRDLRQMFATKATFIFGESRQDETKYRFSNVRHGAPTSDVVVCQDLIRLAEKYGYFQMAIDEWKETKEYVSTTNIVIVGSGVVNTYAYSINDFLPLRFDRSRATQQIVDAICTKGGLRYGHHDKLDSSHCGLVIFSKSPFNLKKRMLWVAGITGLATAAAALCAKTLVESGNSVLKSFKHPIGCVVVPKLPFGVSPDQYRGGQSIRHCKIVGVLNHAEGGWHEVEISI
jgi:hypothetical protein